MSAVVNSDRIPNNVELSSDKKLQRALGVTSVPTFIIDRRHAVVGAEDPAVLAEAIRLSLQS